jgi:hypothetical protein
MSKNPKPRVVHIFKAQPEETESIIISIDRMVPNAVNLDAARVGYNLQAESLVKEFIAVLPGGTVDALFAKLAAHKAGLLKIAHEPKTKN